MTVRDVIDDGLSTTRTDTHRHTQRRTHLGIGEGERVVEVNDGVGGSGNRLEVGLAGGKLGGLPSDGGGREGRRGGEESGEEGELHYDILLPKGGKKKDVRAVRVVNNPQRKQVFSSPGGRLLHTPFIWT